MGYRQLVHVRLVAMSTALFFGLSGAAGGGVAVLQAQGVSAQQTTYATPDEAKDALVTAAKNKDRPAMDRIFGPGANQLMSGDAVEDNKDFEDFSSGVAESTRLEKRSESQFALVIGTGQYPFPVPIVKQGARWMFDTKAGTEEILNRRIGENELSAIATTRAYVVAQWEYFTEGDWDRDGVAEYAQHLVSSPGKHDGLYWETGPNAKPSPLGALVAAARAEGYTASGSAKTENSSLGRAPFHGYYFKILTAQGPHAAGGKYSYIINGNMIAGYAMVAYPDSWGKSGVMTFIVNQQGRVYEKNLGPNSAAIAGAMTVFNPDPTWKVVSEQ